MKYTFIYHKSGVFQLAGWYLIIFFSVPNLQKSELKCLYSNTEKIYK